MNIFIYGNASFKSDIHKIFDHSNIKFRMGENDSIQEIKTLIELRTAIEKHPKEIFLIDDAKIYRKNALSEKIKFLKPKGAIEEEFIKEHGIDDISIDSLEDLPKYIIEKLNDGNDEYTDDDYHNTKDNLDIQESIIDIVDEAYNDEEKDESLTKSDNIGDIDKENDKIQLDDELSSLLSAEEDSVDDDLDNFELEDLPELESLEELESLPELESLEEFDALPELESLEELNDLEQVNNNTEDEIIKGEGENMSDDFSELDNLNESDILAALDGLEDIDANSIVPAQIKPAAQSSSTSQSNVGVEMGGSNVNEIAALISNLLNNKTLEITIKVKA